MSRIIFNSTDDNVVEGTITINDGTDPIPSDATIIAFVQNVSASIKIMENIPINAADGGNDWTNRKIRGVFPKISSAALADYDNETVEVCVRVTINDFTETFCTNILANKLL